MAPPTFPPEIHSLIIRFATYTPVYFDVSPDPQFWPVDGELYSGIAADYATKKALMLVSRQFRHMSLPYLYEVVEVHKSSNMHRLAEVLDMRSSETTSSGQQNPRKIVHLFVSVLETNDGRGKLAVFNSLGRVLTRCRSLQGFGLLDAAPYTLDTPCDWWISIPKGIRFADWHGSIMACDFAQMIDGISESLMALRISKSPYQTSSPRVSLPRLTHLSILEGDGIIDVLGNWSMPLLTHLFLNVSRSDVLVRFIERVRTSLRSVVLGHKATVPTLISQIPTVAQNLQEYTYYLIGGMETTWALVGSHPSLQSIVVVVHAFRLHGHPPTKLYNHFRPLTSANFPKLRCVGLIGIDPYDDALDTDIRAVLDKLLDSWNASGIEVRYLGG